VWIMSISHRTTPIILVIVLLLLFVAPASSLAKTTVTMQVAFGGIVCSGVGLCFYFFYSHEFNRGSSIIRPAMMNIREGKIKWGFPAVDYRRLLPEHSVRSSEGLYHLKLLRWEF